MRALRDGNRQTNVATPGDGDSRAERRVDDGMRPEDLGIGELFERIRDAVIVADAKTQRIVLWNSAATNIFGYSTSEALKLSVEVLIPKQLKAKHRAGMSHYAETGRGPYIDSHGLLELPALKKGGEEIHVELSLSPIGPVDNVDGDGRFVLAIVRDITERKRAEEEIKETNRRLEELASLRANFAAMVAHEIGSPLATIRGFLEMLATAELKPAEQVDTLAKIQTETDRLSTLVADIRSAAAIEREDFALMPRRTSVDELLEDTIRFAEMLPGDHPLVVEAATEEQVWADRYRIGQVLRNLLSNAAKYSPDGAPIELRVVCGKAPGRLRIEVADYGRGVHPDDVERIFEKFGRGRDRSGQKAYGVGLGLYLSRRIVRAHGSELTLNSTPGTGSVFGFELEVAR